MNHLRRLIILVAFLTGLTAFASGVLPDEEKLEAAIQANDLSTVKSILDGAGDLSDRSYVLNYVFPFVGAEGKPICRTEIVKFLLQHGAVPTETSKTEKLGCGLLNAGNCSRELSSHLSHATNLRCKEIVNLFVERIPADSLWDYELKKAINDLRPYGFPMDSSESNESMQTDVEIFDSIKNTLKRGCDKITDLCAEYKEMDRLERANLTAKKADEAERNDRKQNIKDQSDREAFLKTPEGTLKLACAAQNEIWQADRLIAHEKEVGAAAGVINKQALYTQGQRKVVNHHDLEKLRAKYKSQTGRVMQMGSCKKVTGAVE